MIQTGGESMTPENKKELILFLAEIGWIAFLILSSPIMILIEAMKQSK